MGSFRDLTGQKYNRLTVIRLAEKRGKNYYYECECECGNRKLIRAGQITSGGTKSCGCLQREAASKTKRRIGNKYELCDGFVKVYLSNSDEFMICDADDWEYAKQFTWGKDAYGYATASVKSKHGDNRNEKFHIVLFGVKSGLVIDHINRNKLDNRKINLRRVTQHANTTNQSLRKNNTSGFTGVKFRKDTKRWSASIMLNGQSIALGCYNTKEKAIEARLLGEERYFKPLFCVDGGYGHEL